MGFGDDWTQIKDKNDGPPALPDDFDVPVDTADDTPPVYVPIGFDPDTARAMAEGTSGVPPGITWTETVGPFGDERGAPVYYRDYYTDAGLDDIIRNMSPESVKDLQYGMLQAGLLGPNDDIRYGLWDDNTRGAFRDLLGLSNRSGSRYSDMLNRLIQNPLQSRSGGGGGGVGRAPFQAQIPNQDELKAGFGSVRSSMLGGQWTTDDDAELSAAKDEFAKDFTGEVVGAQRAAYDGRTVEQAPSLEFSAQERVKRDEAAGVNANLFRGYAQAMTEALGG